MAVKSWSVLVGAGIGVVVLAGVAASFVVRLVRSNREQLVASGPLLPDQELPVAAAGELVLLLETPRLDTQYDTLSFTVTDRSTGDSTTMRYHYAEAQGAIHGVSTVKVPFGRITARGPTTYQIHVAGMAPGKDYSRSRIVISRPYLGRMTLQIIGIVLSAVGALLCLVAGALQLASG